MLGGRVALKSAAKLRIIFYRAKFFYSFFRHSCSTWLYMAHYMALQGSRVHSPAYAVPVSEGAEFLVGAVSAEGFSRNLAQKKLIVSRQPIQLTLNLYHEKHVAKL